MIKTTLKARAIAYYLPQYHPVEVNDKFWGTGFTEWTNVTKAKPLFSGHAQPKLPADLGFYDLRVPEVREQQAQLAQDHGIEGFCYWHYWFGNNVQVLETIFNDVLSSKKPDFPFCLAWANESWTGRWHGLDSTIIIEQKYPGDNDIREHFYSLLPAFRDERYIRVEGKVLFLVYRPMGLANPNRFVDIWQELAQKEGIGEFYFVGVGDQWDYQTYGFNGYTDSRLSYPEAEYKMPAFSRLWSKLLKRKLPEMVDYELISNKLLEQDFSQSYFPTVLPNWDNTPRSGVNGRIYQNSTPDAYYRWLSRAIDKLADRPTEKRLIFLKSWNEWAEGNYLEPDREFGDQYLQVTKKAIVE